MAPGCFPVAAMKKCFPVAAMAPEMFPRRCGKKMFPRRCCRKCFPVSLPTDGETFRTKCFPVGVTHLLAATGKHFGNVSPSLPRCTAPFWQRRGNISKMFPRRCRSAGNVSPSLLGGAMPTGQHFKNVSPSVCHTDGETF